MTNTSDWTPDFGELNASPPTWAAKRPLRIALLGDFGAGALKGRLDTGADLAARRPIPVEFDSLDNAIARLELNLQLPLGRDGANVAFDINELESFHPDELYRNLKVFSSLADLRRKLNSPTTFASAAAALQKMAGTGAPKPRRARARGAAPSSSARLSDFARLTGRADSLRPVSSVDALLQSLVAPYVQPAANPAKATLLATLDTALADAMRGVLHHPEFQNLESLWRGVDFLLRRLETGPQLQVHLIDISAEEFAADLSSVSDLVDTSLYQLLVQRPGKEAGGGYSLVCGCYQFDSSPPHAELLGRMAQIAAQAGAPFITAMQTEAFRERRKPPHPLVRQAFSALQALPSAGFLSLFGPRFLQRLPYGKRSDPVSSFAFEEFTASEGLNGMLWGHPGLLAVCALVAQDSNLTLTDMPFHHVLNQHGDSVALPCTERVLSNDTATLMRQFGIGGLLAHRGEPLVRLGALQAVNGDQLQLNATKTAPKKLDARFVFSSQLPSEKRKSSAPAKADSDDADDSGNSDDDSSASDDSNNGSSEDSLDMDNLLASMGGDENNSESSDTANSTSDYAGESTDSTNDEMDPELAAMLKDLQ